VTAVSAVDGISETSYDLRMIALSTVSEQPEPAGNAGLACAHLPEENLLTLEDVAKLLQVPPSLVGDRVRAQAWPHVRLGPRTIRMTLADVRRVIEMHHVETARQPLGTTSRSEAIASSKRLQELMRRL